MSQFADKKDYELYTDGYHAGMVAAATLCKAYAHDGASTLSRNVAYAIERRIYAAIDDMQKQKK